MQTLGRHYALAATAGTAGVFLAGAVAGVGRLGRAGHPSNRQPHHPRLGTMKQLSGTGEHGVVDMGSMLAQQAAEPAFVWGVTYHPGAEGDRIVNEGFVVIELFTNETAAYEFLANYPKQSGRAYTVSRFNVWPTSVAGRPGSVF